MSVMRYDMASGEALTTKAVVKEDGTIEARSIITSIGVFPYRLANGTIRRELRTPEVVFDQAFIESVKNIPIYINHQVNADGSLITDTTTMENLAVGRTDNNPTGDNVYLSAGVSIFRKDGIEAVNKGIRSFSVGYSSDIVMDSGVWCGQSYDAVQTNLRGNHLALVRVGRQGDQAILRLDSDDAIMETGENATVVAEDNEPIRGNEMADNMKTVKIDTVDYQCEAPVAVELNNVKVKLDSTQKDLEATIAAKSALEAERDSLKERLDSVDAKVKELELSRVDEAMIAKRVADRVTLMDLAKKAEVEVKADASDMDIKKSIVMKVFANAKLDGKDDAYINARFDCACEDMEKLVVEKADASVRAAGAVTTVNTDSADKETVAKKAYIDRLQNGYLNVTKGDK
jgi:hypothetical protein